MRDDIREALERMGQSGVESTLNSIEVAVWLIFGLLVIFAIGTYIRFEKRRSERASQQSDWSKAVERAFDRGDYRSALQTLETSQVMFPGSASILFWQARCHFRLEEWERAAEKFEACLRQEPFYRQSAKDYMAFIELNGLVPGVEGYLEK
jgi:tetratricopeptide (TPR) repeat protein